jgi:hypothetical protein
MSEREVWPEPTYDQLDAHAQIQSSIGRTGTACWYPQMGGFSAKAIVTPDAECFDVFVWHDGDFPFRTDSDDWHPSAGEDLSVRELHHCSAEQFVDFGQMLLSLPTVES